MPEGDTVLAAANNLHQLLSGQPLVVGDLNWPSAPPQGLSGCTIVEVGAYAKHMLMRLDDGRTLRTHLRMDGAWRIVRPAAREARQVSGYVRAVLGTSQWTALGYRLGLLDVFPTEREAETLAHMGPDILADASVPTPLLKRTAAEPLLRLAPRYAHEKLHVPQRSIAEQEAQELAAGTIRYPAQQAGGRDTEVSDYGWRVGIARFAQVPPERGIGETLLDQTVVSGIGTIHMAEALFALGISPWRAVGEVEIPKLLATARANMVRSTLDYPKGRVIHVHSRAGQQCHRCGHTLEVADVGPELKRRPAFFCPHCQKN